MKNLLFFILGILFLISCETEKFQEIETQNQLKITASIAELKTRANETNFQEGDVIKLFINEINIEDTLHQNYINSSTKIIEARLINNEWILDSIVYYPKNVTDSCLRIIALFNGGKIISDTSIMGNSINMFSTADTINDFLCCYVKCCFNSINPIDLKFEHKLSKLKINVIDTDNIGIRNWNINFYGLDFNYIFYLNNLNIENGNGYDTTYISSNSFIKQLIIPEQNIYNFDVIINKDTPAENRKNFYQSDLKTENGKITYLNINVKRNSLSIDSQILPWGEGETYNKDF